MASLFQFPINRTMVSFMLKFMAALRRLEPRYSHLLFYSFDSHFVVNVMF